MHDIPGLELGYGFNNQQMSLNKVEVICTIPIFHVFSIPYPLYNVLQLKIINIYDFLRLSNVSFGV